MIEKTARKKSILIMLVCLIVVATANAALAYTAPTATDIGYDFYDFAKKLSTGPPALTVGIGGMAMAAFFLFKQQLIPACATAVGVIGVLKSTDILASLPGLIF